MSFTAIASVLILYPLILLGDGCLLIAVAVASSTRGHAWLWGASFAAFHALYGIVGITLTSQASVYSELLGELFTLGGATFLLWHFVHHRLHHRVHNDCSCENHPATTIRPLAVVSSAAGLSLHSLAGGAIIHNLVPDVSNSSLITLLVAASCVLGILTYLIVRVGELEQVQILRLLDRLPGIVGFVLSMLCCGVLFHMLRDWVLPSSLLAAAFWAVAMLASSFVAYSVHGRNESPIVKIGPRK